MEKWIKRIVFFLFIGLILTIPTTRVQAKESGSFNDNENGTVTITYNKAGNKRVKIAVFKGETKYYYELNSGQTEIVIPLTEGNGTYKIMICKNVKDTQYAIVETTSVELKLDDENEPFAQCSQIVKWKETNAAIKKANALASKYTDESKQVKAIYNYIVKNFSYDYDKIDSISKSTTYVPDITVVYKDKKGICYDFSVLFAAMTRSIGVETKVVTGYAKTASVYHAWNEVYSTSEGKWQIVDTTYDAQMYAAGKKYNMVKSQKDYYDIVYTY